MTITKISVVGLGKLGEPFAVCLASRGFDVLGVDLDERKVDTLNAGTATVAEPGLQRLLTEHKARFRATTDISRAVAETDVTFLLVNTPSRADGSFSNEYLIQPLRFLAYELYSTQKKYHLFIIGSTVSPGACEKELMPELGGIERLHRFGLCYCPELVALGSVVNGFLNPDVVYVGQSDDRAGDLAVEIYDQLCPAAPTVRMTLAEAEIVKVSLNFFLTLKISFANTLAEICEAFPGADVDRISWAIGYDHRISRAFLKGGLAFGGFCFPRDVVAFRTLCRQTLNGLPWLARAVKTVNKAQYYRLVLKVPHSDSVSVLGLAFKPGTPEIEASPAIHLIESLVNDHTEVFCHDPVAMDKVRTYFQKVQRLHFCDSAKECAGKAPVVVIATAWPEYTDLDESDFQEGAVVIDCWRLLKHKLKDSEHVTYKAIGMG